MMNKKISILFALPLLAVLLLAACGGDDDSTPTQTPDRGATAPRISAGEVKAKLDAGDNIVIVDARSVISYNREHIVGAISIPEVDLPLSPEEIAKRYPDLQDYDEIITYCA